MSISSTWVDSCPPTGLTVLVWSTSSSSILTGIDTQLWMDFSPNSCWVFGTFANKQDIFFDLLGEKLFTHGSLRSWYLGFWFWLDSLGVLAASSYFWIQFFHPITLEGNRRRPRWHIYFLVYDFTSFHHNNFWDTISWKRVVKNDSVRSCLIEPQSFVLSKLHVDPNALCLGVFPRFLIVPCKTWCVKVNLVRIFVFLIHRIHYKKEYCLSVAQNLTSRCQILNLWRNVNWLHIKCDKCSRRKCPELKHCPVVKDQWDCVLNDLEELGDEFLVLMDQYNIEIFSCFLLLLPLYPSTFHQTNVEIVQNYSEDHRSVSEFDRSIFFSR